MQKSAQEVKQELLQARQVHCQVLQAARALQEELQAALVPLIKSSN